MNRLSILILSITTVLILSSCASRNFYDAHELNYKGDVVTISDSMGKFSGRSAHFFTVSKVGDLRVWNSADASIQSGPYGGRLNPSVVSRDVRVGKTRLTLLAGRAVVAPVDSWFGSSYLYISKEIEVELNKGQSYIVTGVVGQEYTKVSLLDGDGNIIAGPFEKFKSDKLSEDEKDIRRTAIVKKPIENYLTLPKDEFFLQLPEINPSIEIVVQKLGEPDTVEEGKKNWQGQVVTNYIYEGLGLIKFVSANEFSYLHSVQLRMEPNNLTLQDYNRLLQSTHPKVFRQFVLFSAKEKISDRAILDLFAQKLWDGRNTVDPKYADVLAWITKVLAKSEDLRYSLILDKLLLDETLHPKLTKYAKSSKKLLEKSEFGINESKFLPKE